MLIFAGFVNVEAKSENGKDYFLARKSSWNSNAASAPLRKLNVKKPENAAKKWVLESNDLDLDDEDSLLANEKFQVKVQKAAKPAADCGVGNGPAKKACKNCTCGLAEEQAAAAANVSAENNAVKVSSTGAVKSACGSCYLGDAFRCSTCPYLGMPAFKPGEKVKLDL
jgi:hypothetical protein